MHATLAGRLPRILRQGLLTAKSRGKLPAVWLCSRARMAWACLHVLRRHGGLPQEVVVVEVTVPRAWLRRSRQGLWYVRHDIGPERIRNVLTFGELSRSPADEAA
jgi:hypothetical protein